MCVDTGHGFECSHNVIEITARVLRQPQQRDSVALIAFGLQIFLARRSYADHDAQTLPRRVDEEIGFAGFNIGDGLWLREHPGCARRADAADATQLFEGFSFFILVMLIISILTAMSFSIVMCTSAVHLVYER